MAKRISTVTVTIEASQARKEMDELRQRSEALGKTIRELKNQRDSKNLTKTSQEWLKIDRQIKEATKSQKELDKLIEEGELKIKGIDDILSDMSKSTYNELQRAQRQLLVLVKSLEPNTKEYEKYNEQLRNVASRIEELKKSWRGLSEESQMAAEKQRQAIVDNPLKHSVGQIKDALKLTQEIRDAQEIGSADYSYYQKEVESLQKVLDLNKKIADEKERQEAEARRVSTIANMGDASVDNLKEAIKLTQELRDSSTKISSDDYKKYTEQINALKIALDGAEKEVVDLNRILANPKKASLEDLQKAAKQLEAELAKMAPDTKAFIEESAKLRTVNERMGELKDNWKEHDNLINQSSNSLKNYFLAYVGLNAAIEAIKKTVSGALELSDSMSDVQKTTGLAGEELQKLSKEIDGLDTRSTQQQLHELAAVAGQMGMTSREQVVGFVSAANQLNVALDELGAEGVGNLTKVAMLTGELDRLGVEKSLLSIGSAINALSAASPAAAGPIAEFIRRTGSIAPVANLATSDLAALGATADALGQTMEVSGTAMNKFISAVVNNTDGIAYALNMNKQDLQDLVETGQTMEAIIKVLEAVKTESEAGGAALNDVFKEFGSEGERMTRVIQAMSEKTEFLKEQVALSAKAFEESVSVTEEYNVKNENAAALMERIGNVWREAFVNANTTSILTDILKSLLEFSKLLTSVSKAGVVFRSILVAWGTQLAATALGLNRLAASLFSTKAGTDALTLSWKKLSAAMKANWLGLVLAAIAGIWNAVSNWNKEQKELNASIAELNGELQKEKKNLGDVERKLESVKNNTQARADLVREINGMYGSYIGNQLDEAAGYEEIAAALTLVNEQLDLKYSKMIYDKRMSRATEEYTKETEDATKRMINALKEMPSVGEKAYSRFSDIMVAVQKLSEYEGELDPMALLDKEGLNKTLNLFGANSVGSVMVGETKDRVEKAFRELLKAQIEYNEKSKAARAEEDANVSQQQTEMIAARNEFIAKQRQQLDELLSTPADVIGNMSEEQLKSHYERILNYGNSLLKEANNQYKEYVLTNKKTDKETDEQYKDRLLKTKNDLVDSLESKLESTRKAYAGDAWGKAFNIEGWKNLVRDQKNISTASVDNLVKTYKEMELATQKYTDVNELNKWFDTNFTNIKDMQKYIHGLSQNIAQELASRGRTTSGDFLKEKADAIQRQREQDLKKEIDSAETALKTYYSEQERIINEAYMRQEISSIEHNRQIMANQQQMKRSFADLYSSILGETKEYNTDFTNILSGVNLEDLSTRMGQWGEQLIGEMRQSRAKNQTEIQAEAMRLRKLVEDAMDDGNIFEKLKQDFKNTLDELLILSRNLGDGMFVGVDDKMATGLIKSLTDVADEAYNVNEQGLRELLSQNIEYGEWWADKTDAEIAIVLQKLRTYYDDRMELQRRYAQRMQREWKTYYKQSGGEAEYAQNEQAIEGMASKYDAYESMGIRKNYNAERGEIQANAALRGSKVEDEIEYYQDLLKTKTAGSEEYIAIQAVIANKQLELNNIIQQSEIETTNVTLEQWQKRAEALSGWAEMVGETMGEVWMLERKADQARVRGDEETAKELEAQAKESRQNLVKEALNKAIDMAKVWAMELGFKVMYNALAKKSDEDVAASGAKASLKSALADIIAQGFKGAGKEIGSKGIAGLVTGGVIIAAAAGLAALAKSAVANMFPEATEGVSDAEASTPKRKLTTGMLTYAEGKYPVLGNDGVVYDAEYAGSNMKTGVYRKPHFGIFAEKQPEMVIDGKTTQRLVLNYPEVYSGILELSRTGRMGMRTYATGNVLEIGEGYDAQAYQAQQQAQMEEMRQTMVATAAALAALTHRLDQPIHAEMNYFGKGGAREAEQRGSRWAARNRVR